MRAPALLTDPLQATYVIHSPVAPLIVDPQGRRLGHDPVIGAWVNDFGSLATDSGPNSEPEVLTISMGSVVTGLYQFSGVGTVSGAYAIELKIAMGSDPSRPIFDEIIASGTANPTQPIDPLPPIDFGYLESQVMQGATTTLLTSDHPSGSEYGHPVTFSAAVSSAATPTGSVQFDIDGIAVGSPVTLVNGIATFTTATLNAGNHAVTDFFTSDSSENSSERNSSAVPFTYDVAPAPLSVKAEDKTKVYGQDNPPFTYTITGFVNDDDASVLSGTPSLGTSATMSSGVGTYAITLDAGSLAAPNYTFSPVNGALSITPATPTLNVTGVHVTYDGAPHPAAATATGVNGEALGPLSFTYNGSAVPPTNAGSYAVGATFVGNDNYAAASDSSAIVLIDRATPALGLISSPTVIVGTSSATISGKINLGSLAPTGNVTITLNAVSESAAVNADGTFSALFATGTLGAGAYPISYSYGGDPNFNSASGAGTLDVTYNVTLLAGLVGPKQAGSTISFQIQLSDAAGIGVSSPTLEVTALGIALVGSPDDLLPAESPGNANPDNRFTVSGGRFKYNLKTSKTLAAGKYLFYFTIEGDPLVHSLEFEVK